jgi:hypothetical protein
MEKKRMSFSIKEMLSRDQMKKIKGGTGPACFMDGVSCQIQGSNGICMSTINGCICAASGIPNGAGNCATK